jgi:glycerol-3-phosphate acyltransferase PlsY
MMNFYNGYAGVYIGGMASLLGHAFPVYYGFKGGKCVASTFFMVLCTEPLIALVCLLFFIAVVAATKFISVGSLMSVIVYPLILNRWTGAGLHNLIAILAMLFVVYLHRQNIMRLINGKENKLEFKKKKENT